MATEYKKPSDVMEAVGVSGVLSAGLTWHVVGEGLAWAEFTEPADAVKYTATKRGKGRKFAVMVFEPGKQFSGVIYLTSVKRGLDAGRVITEGQLLDLYHGKKEKPAEKTSQASEKKPAAKTVKAAKKPVKETGFTVVTLDHKDLQASPAAVKSKVEKALSKPATKKATKTTTQKPAAGLSKFGPWTVDHAGHAWAKAGSRYAVITWGDGQEVKSSMQDKKEGLKKGTLQTFDQVMALTQPPKPNVKQGDFERLYDWLYKHGMNKYQRLATEYDKLSEDTLSDFYTAANAFQRERGDLLTSDREVIAYMMALYGIDPAKQAIKEAAKSVKDTGFAMITLDHKDLAAPAKNVKKAVKALTEPAKKPATKKKSKSRIKLEKAQEDAQTMQISAVEFVTFCARINSGRKKPYSTKNCELIFTQTDGHATDVRGFKSWIKAGRAVKKDQKSIVIEAPRFVYDDKGEIVLDKHGKPKMYAVPCCVFDISQTEELKEKKEA